MFNVRRVSGRLEERLVHCQESKWKPGRLEDMHVHCQESKWKANMEAGTSYITKRLSGRLLGRHVHFLPGD
jgi:hypothetical protein